MSSATTSGTLGTADIVGIVIGGVLGLATVIGLIFSVYAMCCQKNKQAQVWAQPYPNAPPNGPNGQPSNTGYYSQQPPYQQPPYNNKQPINQEQPPSYSAVYQGSNSYGKY